MKAVMRVKMERVASGLESIKLLVFERDILSDDRVDPTDEKNKKIEIKAKRARDKDIAANHRAPKASGAFAFLACLKSSLNILSINILSQRLDPCSKIFSSPSLPKDTIAELF